MTTLERLDKILSNMGYGSRKEVKLLIKSGKVTINGKVAIDNSLKINPYENKICVEGNEICYRKYIYLMINKPQNTISSTYDPLNTTVIDLIDDKYKNFKPFPVGRLDKDTEGLLILTNDGNLAHNLLSPNKHVEKKYYALIRGKVDNEDVISFSKGVTIDGGYTTKPSKLTIIKSDDISKIEIIITEGKFHQIKRMFRAVGKEVIYLKRLSMGQLILDDNLSPGEYRELSDEEVNLLLSSYK